MLGVFPCQFLSFYLFMFIVVYMCVYFGVLVDPNVLVEVR